MQDNKRQQQKHRLLSCPSPPPPPVAPVFPQERLAFTSKHRRMILHFPFAQRHGQQSEEEREEEEDDDEEVLWGALTKKR